MFLDNLDMVAQSRKQKAFLTMVFGGPNDYTNKEMRTGHGHLGPNDEHVDAVVENLANTLDELGVISGDIQEVGAIAENVSDDVQNR